MCGLEKLDNGNWRRELRLGLMPAYSTGKDGRFVVPVNEADMRFDFYCDNPATRRLSFTASPTNRRS